ncbi:MAG: PQQ-dependent sugar dehydrogenase, partial [Wenzhouxiangellaceae bacterium]|nr:PQQ-dependent sugar dehydrogenase [Wenzhouxiangellaceae bacterium]
MSFSRALLALGLSALMISSTEAETLRTEYQQIELERLADGLDEPWGMTFLPDGSLLISERTGRLLRFERGRLREIAGTPEVAAR